MATYLVRARPKRNRLADLEKLLVQQAFRDLRPFGKALTAGLQDARIGTDGLAFWEEEDYCSPPLAMERGAVLDTYFEEIQVEAVKPGDGWRRIRDLPPLFPALPPAPD